MERYEQLVKDYGFLEKDDVNRSTLDITSGDILGNPFVFIKRIIHWIDDIHMKVLVRSSIQKNI